MKKIMSIVISVLTVLMLFASCSGSSGISGQYINKPENGYRSRLTIMQDGTFKITADSGFSAVDSGKAEKTESGEVILTADDGSVYCFTQKGHDLILDASKSKDLPEDESIAPGFADGTAFIKRVK